MWNQVYDVKTLLNRLTKIYSTKKELKVAGINPRDQMITDVSDKRLIIVKNSKDDDVYITPFAYYTSHPEKALVDRMDSFSILDGCVWLDQMLCFANIRKTSGLRESYALDAIAGEELGKEKQDYTGYTIKNLAWKNFDLFATYNIMDVVLLHLLEKKNLDMEMMSRLSEITNTRVEKVFKKTISIKNFVNKFAEQQGYVMGNNKNAQYGNESKYFEDNFLNKKQLIENDQNYIDAFAKKENFGA